VWESNPPFDPLRTESPALKAGEITGPLSPPLFVRHFRLRSLLKLCNPPVFRNCAAAPVVASEDFGECCAIARASLGMWLQSGRNRGTGGGKDRRHFCFRKGEEGLYDEGIELSSTCLIQPADGFIVWQTLAVGA
jgi:hypothetical protein